MPEYIERENLFKFLTEQMTRKQNGAFAKGFNKGIMVARAAVHNREITPAAEVVEIPKSGIGHLSDGYHTFNELYHHRAVLFSVICNACPERAWKSKLHDTGDMFDGMFIVGIETLQGQATYHYDIEPYWDMFRIKEIERAPKWDGHTPQDAINRISEISIGHDEVVRCKDCDYYDGYDCERLGLQLIDSDCYCSWAKKKAGEG